MGQAKQLTNRPKDNPHGAPSNPLCLAQVNAEREKAKEERENAPSPRALIIMFAVRGYVDNNDDGHNEANEEQHWASPLPSIHWFLS